MRASNFSPYRVGIMVFVVLGVIFGTHDLYSQTSEINTPTAPTDTLDIPGDLPPTEPPYTQTNDVELKAPETSGLEYGPAEKKTIDNDHSKDVSIKPRQEQPKGKYKIHHPDASKGLYRIDQNTGRYYYKIEKTSKKNQTTSIRFGSIEPPNLTAENSLGSFTFADVYGSDNIPYLIIDYEWFAFHSFGKVGLQLGMGFFTKTGNGRFVNNQNKPDMTDIAKESYTFIGLPMTAGGLYRFEFGKKQWVVPFVNGGLSYFALSEIRDDGKKTKIIGTPAVYGAGGLMFNITAWDREISYTMDSEYGINNMWLTAEYRYFASLNEDIDINSSIINVGISVDY